MPFIKLKLILPLSSVKLIINFLQPLSFVSHHTTFDPLTATRNVNETIFFQDLGKAPAARARCCVHLSRN